MEVLKTIVGAALSAASALICQWYKNCQTARFMLGGTKTQVWDLFKADSKGSIVNMKYRFFIKGSPYVDPAYLIDANIPTNYDPNAIIDPLGNYYTIVAVVILWVPQGEESNLAEINILNRNETGGNGGEEEFALYPVLGRVIDGRFFQLNGYSDPVNNIIKNKGYIFEGGFKNRTHPADVIGSVSKGDTIKLLTLTTDNIVSPLKPFLNLNKVNQYRASLVGTLTYDWLSDVQDKNSKPILTENFGNVGSVN